MKLTRKQLKTLIKKSLYESVTELSPSSQPTSTIVDHWSELTGVNPEKLTKLIDGFLKNEDPTFVKQGISIAITIFIPEDDIISVAYNYKNGWQQDGVNWYLLQEFPSSLFWQTITSLNLFNKQLTFLPDSIGNLTNLTHLFLSYNQLTSLPDSIGNLTNLTKLELSENELTSLPDSIGYLTNLTTLDLRKNQLTSLPNSIGNLTNLTILELRANQLTSLPDWIGNLTNLTHLGLNYNQLTSLPDSIGNLTNLPYLDLRMNELTSLPDSIGNLTNLKALYVEGNQLTELPDSIRNLNLANFFNQFNKAELDRLGMSHLWNRSNYK